MQANANISQITNQIRANNNRSRDGVSARVTYTPSPRQTRILFQNNSAVVLDEDATNLTNFFNARIRPFRRLEFSIQGNTSSRGSEADNLQLSIDRINAVLALFSNLGLDMNRVISAEGVGENNADQNNPDNPTDRNIIFTPNTQDYEAYN